MKCIFLLSKTQITVKPDNKSTPPKWKYTSDDLVYGFCNTEYHAHMIHSFAGSDTEALFHSKPVPQFRNIERVARRKLLQLHAATELNSLRIPPGNRLELLKGNRDGQYSIRINDQWRVCFVWQEDGAYEVEIVDYH